MKDPAETRRNLLVLYEEVDDATRAFLERVPLATCDAGCADCCKTRPPLVAREEAELVVEAVRALPEELRTLVVDRARALAGKLARGMEPDFECPLLVENRCSIYAARPYACRTFGYTARIPPDENRAIPFACEKLHPRVARAQPPAVPFRSEALRRYVGVDVMADSYLPIWVGLTDDEQEERASGPGRAVVVGTPRTS